MKNCIYCGHEIPSDHKFCGKCGKEQVKKYTQTFRRINISESEFIEKINRWFASYPNVANVKGEFLLNHSFGMLVNKYTLDALSIEYELFKGENENQYAVVDLTKFGFTRTDSKDLLAQWQSVNPNATIVTYSGGHNARGSSGSLALGGFGATNNTQLYVLFKFNRKRGTK